MTIFMQIKVWLPNWNKTIVKWPTEKLDPSGGGAKGGEIDFFNSFFIIILFDKILCQCDQTVKVTPDTWLD